MLTIIYPYRNRELTRVSNSLDSLVQQYNKEFCVLFMDYGSDFATSFAIKKLLEQSEFVKQIYSYHKNQPWSRSKAINIGLKFVKTQYVFIADVDIIFHKKFINKTNELKYENQITYFQVGYLDENESKQVKDFDSYIISSKSIPEGRGLSLFKTETLLEIGGFDEFFHFWGAEDEDIYARLEKKGMLTKFYNSEILLLHQWHKSFENLEKKKLTLEPMFPDVFSFNKQKLRFNEKNKILNTNNESWGKLITENEFQILEEHNNVVKLLNKKHVVDNFINIVLPNTHSKIINVVFEEELKGSSLKNRLRNFLKIKIRKYYSLKEINDLILKTLIVYYRNYPYSYVVSHDLKSIHFKIEK